MPAVLFGLASEVKIWPQAPILDRTYGIEKGAGNPASQVRNSVFTDIRIGQQYAHENRWFARRVRSQTVRDVHNLRPQALRSLSDKIAKLGLVDVSSGNVHDSIIWPRRSSGKLALARETDSPRDCPNFGLEPKT